MFSHSHHSNHPLSPIDITGNMFPGEVILHSNKKAQETKHYFSCIAIKDFLQVRIAQPHKFDQCLEYISSFIKGWTVHLLNKMLHRLQVVPLECHSRMFSSCHLASHIIYPVVPLAILPQHIAWGTQWTGLGDSCSVGGKKQKTTNNILK